MTRRELTPLLKKTKRLVLEGKRGAALAKCLGVATSTAYGYIHKLVYLGELIDISGDDSTTPRVYVDGRKEPPFKGTFRKQNAPQPDIEKSDMGVPSSNAQDKSGRPPKNVRVHCTGAYVVPVFVVGDHYGAISDADGYTVGDWSPEKNANGSIRQYGTIRLVPGEDLHFTFYQAKNGPKLTVTPCPREVYYKTADTVGRAALADQVNSLLDFLTENHGWLFGLPVFDGVHHFAMTSPEMAPLLKYADRQTDADGARVHADSSNGDPEIEIYEDNPQAQKDIITLCELPDRIDQITASLTAVHSALSALAGNVSQLTHITADLAAAQARQAEIINYVAGAPAFEGVGYL